MSTLEQLNKQLFEVQQEILRAPRKERRKLKEKTAELDKLIDNTQEMMRAEALLKASQQSQQLHPPKGRRGSVYQSATEGSLSSSRASSRGSSRPLTPRAGPGSAARVPVAGGSKGSPGLPRPPGKMSPLSFEAIKPYETSDEGSQRLSDDADSELDANYEYHQQLMGYTTAETHTGGTGGDVTGGDVTGLDHTEVTTARLGNVEALPNELAFLQSFSFLDELDRREQQALKDELGSDEVVTDEEEAGLDGAPQGALALPFAVGAPSATGGSSEHGEEFEFDLTDFNDSFGQTFEVSFGQTLDMAAIEAALQSPASTHSSAAEFKPKAAETSTQGSGSSGVSPASAAEGSPA